MGLIKVFLGEKLILCHWAFLSLELERTDSEPNTNIWAEYENEQAGSRKILYFGVFSLVDIESIYVHMPTIKIIITFTLKAL